jgi:hypothetical protein
VRVPVVVTGEPDTVKIDGRARDTEVTVPAPEAFTVTAPPVCEIVTPVPATMLVRALSHVVPL